MKGSLGSAGRHPPLVPGDNAGRHRFPGINDLPTRLPTTSAGSSLGLMAGPSKMQVVDFITWFCFLIFNTVICRLSQHAMAQAAAASHLQQMQQKQKMPPLSSASKTGSMVYDRPQPTKAQLTMPPNLKAKKQQSHHSDDGFCNADGQAMFGSGPHLSPPGLQVCLTKNWVTFLKELSIKFYSQELPPDESTDLEELEQFAKMFKQKRIKLGRTIYQ